MDESLPVLCDYDKLSKGCLSDTSDMDDQGTYEPGTSIYLNDETDEYGGSVQDTDLRERWINSFLHIDKRIENLPIFVNQCCEVVQETAFLEYSTDLLSCEKKFQDFVQQLIAQGKKVDKREFFVFKKHFTAFSEKTLEALHCVVDRNHVLLKNAFQPIIKISSEVGLHLLPNDTDGESSTEKECLIDLTKKLVSFHRSLEAVCVIIREVDTLQVAIAEIRSAVKDILSHDMTNHHTTKEVSLLHYITPMIQATTKLLSIRYSTNLSVIKRTTLKAKDLVIELLKMFALRTSQRIPDCVVTMANSYINFLKSIISFRQRKNFDETALIATFQCVLLTLPEFWRSTKTQTDKQPLRDRQGLQRKRLIENRDGNENGIADAVAGRKKQRLCASIDDVNIVTESDIPLCCDPLRGSQNSINSTDLQNAPVTRLTTATPRSLRKENLPSYTLTENSTPFTKALTPSSNGEAMDIKEEIMMNVADYVDPKLMHANNTAAESNFGCNPFNDTNESLIATSKASITTDQLEESDIESHIDDPMSSWEGCDLEYDCSPMNGSKVDISDKFIGSYETVDGKPVIVSGTVVSLNTDATHWDRLGSLTERNTTTKNINTSPRKLHLSDSHSLLNADMSNEEVGELSENIGSICNSSEGVANRPKKVEMDFISNILLEFGFQDEGLIEKFRSEGIDEEAFYLLERDDVNNLIAGVGKQLKFYHRLVRAKQHKRIENNEVSTTLDGRTLSTASTCILTTDTDSDAIDTPVSEKRKTFLGDSAFQLLEVLRSSIEGKAILHYYKENAVLTAKLRRKMVALLVSYRMDNSLGGKLNASDFKETASAIVKEFPTESENIYYIPRGVSSRLAYGKLVDKYKNVRYGLSRLGNKDDVAVKAVETSGTSNDESKEMATWLNYNAEPWDEVISKWKVTYKLRKIDIESSKLTTLADFLEKWKILMDHRAHQLIIMDFSEMYPQSEGSIYSNWDYIIEFLECKLSINNSSLDTTMQTIFDMREMNKVARDSILLYLLPHLCQTKCIMKKKNEAKVSWKPTVKEAMGLFILVIEDQISFEQVMDDKRKQLANFGVTVQPFIVLFGDIQNPKEILVCLDKVATTPPFVNKRGFLFSAVYMKLQPITIGYLQEPLALLPILRHLKQRVYSLDRNNKCSCRQPNCYRDFPSVYSLKKHIKKYHSHELNLNNIPQHSESSLVRNNYQINIQNSSALATNCVDNFQSTLVLDPKSTSSSSTNERNFLSKMSENSVN